MSCPGGRRGCFDDGAFAWWQQARGRPERAPFIPLPVMRCLEAPKIGNRVCRSPAFLPCFPPTPACSSPLASNSHSPPVFLLLRIDHEYHIDSSLSLPPLPRSYTLSVRNLPPLFPSRKEISILSRTSTVSTSFVWTSLISCCWETRSHVRKLGLIDMLEDKRQQLSFAHKHTQVFLVRFLILVHARVCLRPYGRVISEPFSRHHTPRADFYTRTQSANDVHGSFSKFRATPPPCALLPPTRFGYGVVLVGAR